MPRLLCLDLDSYRFSEFFSKTKYKNGRDLADIEHDYPHVCYVHQSVLERDPRILIDLRRFIERSAQGDAVYYHFRKDYKFCWNHRIAKSDWDRQWESITNSQWAIYFECAEDLVMFKLTKPGMVHDAPFELHPDYDYHTLETIRRF